MHVSLVSCCHLLCPVVMSSWVHHVTRGCEAVSDASFRPPWVCQGITLQRHPQLFLGVLTIIHSSLDVPDKSTFRMDYIIISYY